MESFQINSATDLARALQVAEAVAPHSVAILLRGTRDGRHSLLTATSETSITTFKRWATVTRGKPAIAVIGDDPDGIHGHGPDGFRVGRHVLDWAASIIVHGAAAEAVHYNMAAAAAQVCVRVAIVECGSAVLPAWTALAADQVARHGKAVLVIKPREGSVARRALQ